MCFSFCSTEVFAEFARSLRVELEFGKSKDKGTKRKPQKKKLKEVEKIDQDEENPPFKLPALKVALSDLRKEKADPIQIEPIDLQFIESENDVIKLVYESITAFTEESIVKIHNKCIRESLIDLIHTTKTDETENVSSKKKEKKGVTKSTAHGDIIYDPKDDKIAYVSPVWTPPTPRSHASILYLYFRKVFLWHSIIPKI